MTTSIFKTLLLITPFFLLSCAGKENKTADRNAVNATGTIRIKGSDTEYLMVKELADVYMAEHPGIVITVEGGGSNKGLAALVNNEADICNSSREIKDDEMAAIATNNTKPFAVMFSVDALAIITNYKIGVDSLSIQQVSQVFNGKIKNWKELGGINKPIKLFGRDKSSGTRNYFSEKFLSGYSQEWVQACESNSAILDSVINTEGAVGYVGAGFLLDKNGKPNGKIWAMPVYIDSHPAYSPYQSVAVKKGDYTLTRPLYQYVNGKPGELIQDFILFELTKRGQEIVMQHGFFPINDYQEQINRLKGIIN